MFCVANGEGLLTNNKNYVPGTTETGKLMQTCRQTLR